METWAIGGAEFHAQIGGGYPMTQDEFLARSLTAWTEFEIDSSVAPFGDFDFAHDVKHRVRQLVRCYREAK